MNERRIALIRRILPPEVERRVSPDIGEYALTVKVPALYAEIDRPRASRNWKQTNALLLLIASS